MKKIGDVSRKRRLFGTQAQMQWYAWYRSLRFARRCSAGCAGLTARPELCYAR